VAKQTSTVKPATRSKSASHQDPICGRRLPGAPSGYSAEYKKRRYYFCSEQCKDAFHVRAERFRMAELARSGSLLTPGKVRWGVG